MHKGIHMTILHSSLHKYIHAIHCILRYKYMHVVCAYNIDQYKYSITIQVNKKFHKFERVYRDCIKMTRDKTRIHCIPHDAPGT